MPQRVDVAIISGSTSDAHIVEKVVKVLEEHGVPFEHQVISAHRNPDELDAYLKKSDARIFIAVAGMSAALPVSSPQRRTSRSSGSR